MRLSQRTQWLSSKNSVTNYSKGKNAKFLYEFVHSSKYRLRNKLVSLAEKVNFDYWKKELFFQTIDITFNAAIIGTGLICLLADNLFLKGLGITLLLIVFKSYAKEYLELFAKR